MPPQHVLGDASSDLHTLLFCFGFQDLSLVCLTDITELVNNAHRALGDADQIALNRESLLRCEHMIVGHAHVVLHVAPLRFGVSLTLLYFTRAHLATKPEFASENDRLLHKKSLFAAAVHSTPDLFTLVADSRVWI